MLIKYMFDTSVPSETVETGLGGRSYMVFPHLFDLLSSRNPTWSRDLGHLRCSTRQTNGRKSWDIQHCLFSSYYRQKWLCEFEQVLAVRPEVRKTTDITLDPESLSTT